MCQTAFNITYTISNSTVTEGEGRYRLEGTTEWTYFSFSGDSGITPNIEDDANYEFEFRVRSSRGDYSDWTPFGSLFTVSTC